MPRTRLLPLIAAVLVAGSRAAGQPVPPTPGTYPDPAAVLLPPVGLDEGQPKPFAPIQHTEPAAKMRAPLETVSYKPADKTTDTDLPRDDFDLPQGSSRKKNWDAYDYLTVSKTGHTTDLPRTSLQPDDDRPLRDGVGGVLDRIREPGKRDRGLFCSDREFDFASPVTNPFLFEDPRALTEVRGLFIGQAIPKGAGPFDGGSVYYGGLQGRVAFGERFSVTVNKLGVITYQPGSGSGVSNSTGLSELWLGPKFVLVRSVESQTLVTLGAIFQIPLGTEKAYQHTGKLSIAPYVSVGQRLLKTDFGSLNALATAGYSFATNRDRSDYLYASGHLDFNWRNRGKFFPLVELNWFQYTANGNTSNFGVEGRDLANFGAAVGRSGLFTGAVGARYRFTDRWEMGGAFEMPFAGNKDLFRYRFTLDVSWRY